MNNKKFLAALLIAFLAGLVVAVVGTYIGTISMPWIVGEPDGEMEPKEITVDMGTLSFDEITTIDPKDSLADLTINEVTNIDVTLSGDLAGISPAIFTLELWQDGGPTLYTTDVSNSIPESTITTVAVGTYDIYIGYEVFGAIEGEGTATITLDYPPT